MINQIPESSDERRELIEHTLKCVRISQDYFQAKLETWVRMWKIYYKSKDTEEETDEPDDFLGYAFGMIEDGVAKITEPILQGNPPCKVMPPAEGMQKQADNFSAIAREHYSKSENQIDFTTANKEFLVTGNRWEFNEWSNEWVAGKTWKEVERQGMASMIKGLAGKLLNIPQAAYNYKSLEEVDESYPLRVGFTTIYPSNFDVFPQPGPKRDRELSWLVRQEREVSLNFLKNQMYVDPQTKEKKPVYDLKELLEDAGEHEPGGIKPSNPATLSTDDWGDQVLRITQATDKRVAHGDEDKVHLYHFYDIRKNRIWTIAQGKFVIRDVKDAYHRPGLNGRLLVYSPDPNNLYGFGMIEPVEDEIYSLNDTHNMGMSNFIRLIHKMVAYQEDAILTTDDFKPVAGGKVRVKKGFVPSQVFMPLEHSDVTKSILSMASYAKGNIERISAMADWSPGTSGTKQGHKTLGGLIQVQNALAVRFSTVRRLILASKQKEMFTMQWMFNQFQFDPIPVPFYGSEGGVTVVSMDRKSIDTGGRPFRFLIEQDPSLGDDNIARNLASNFLSQSMVYEKFRLGVARDPNMPKARVDEAYKRYARSMGYYDTSSIMEQPKGIMEPESEIQLMNQGIPVKPNPDENLTGHLLTHVSYINSPDFQKGVETGQISPKALILHRSHIEATMQMIDLALKNPMKMAQAKNEGQARQSMTDQSVTQGSEEVQAMEATA